MRKISKDGKRLETQKKRSAGVFPVFFVSVSHYKQQNIHRLINYAHNSDIWTKPYIVLGEDTLTLLQT